MAWLLAFCYLILTYSCLWYQKTVSTKNLTRDEQGERVTWYYLQAWLPFIHVNIVVIFFIVCYIFSLAFLDIYSSWHPACNSLKNCFVPALLCLAQLFLFQHKEWRYTIRLSSDWADQTPLHLYRMFWLYINRLKIKRIEIIQRWKNVSLYEKKTCLNVL